MYRWLRVVLLVLAGLVVLVSVAINLVLLPRLDVMLQGAVRRELTLPAEALVVIERGSLAQTLRGYLPRWLVDSPTAVIDGAPFEKVHFIATGVDFNMRRILKGDKAKITAVDSAELTLQVSTEELVARLAPLIEEEGIEQVAIEFGEGTVKVTGKRKVEYIGKIKLAAKGRFIVDGSERVKLQITDVEAGQFNLGVSNLGLEFVEAVPALNLGGMFARVIIDDLRVTSDYLQITAHTEGITDDSVPEDTLDVM